MSLLPELLALIFSYTNLYTVIHGKSTCRRMRILLDPTQRTMMRPPNFRMEICHEYQDSEKDKYTLLTMDDQPYILGSDIDGAYKGFTCMFVTKYRETILFFGYSEQCYVMYRFQKVRNLNTITYSNRCIIDNTSIVISV